MIDSKTIASKTVDIQKGLQEVSLGVPHLHFSNTLKVGKVVRLAANIRGFEVIRNLDRLKMMAMELGIEPDTFDTSILPILEGLNFVEIKKDHTGKIARIEESIPPFGKLLDSAGDYWLEMNPTQIETAGINCLDMTSKTPVPKIKLQESFSELQKDEIEILLDCGKSGKFLQEYQSASGETIVYCPTIWEERSEDVLRLYSKLDQEKRTDVTRIVDQVKGLPGLPLEILGGNKTLLGQMIGTGLLEKSSTISRSSKSRDFLFFPTPQYRLGGLELTDPFDKIKAIISCVRHGEYFAEITKIRNPSLLLQRLFERGHLSPHSESGYQYAILELHGILNIQKVGDRWKPVLVQSDENKEALKNAIELVAEGESFTKKLVNEEARSLLLSGSFIDPIRNRARLKEMPALGIASLKDMMERFRGETFEY